MGIKENVEKKLINDEIFKIYVIMLYRIGRCLMKIVEVLLLPFVFIYKGFMSILLFPYKL